MIANHFQNLSLGGKFPGFTAAFPEERSEFADFGQKSRFLPFKKRIFAAKFAEAGNSGLRGQPLFCDDPEASPGPPSHVMFALP
jgi:hypothetical protein